MIYTWCIINLYMVQVIHAVYTFPKEIFITYKQKKIKHKENSTLTQYRKLHTRMRCAAFHFIFCCAWFNVPICAFRKERGIHARRM